MLTDTAAYMATIDSYPIMGNGSWDDVASRISNWWSTSEAPQSWKDCARRVFSLTITSAAVERAFSTYANRKANQGNALEDLIEVAAMIAWNGPLFSKDREYKHRSL